MTIPAQLPGYWLGIAALWWLLTDGAPSSWVIGAPVTLFAAWWMASSRGGEPRAISVGGLLQFTSLFLVESLRSGVDIARRTLAPRLDVKPGFIEYRYRLNDPSARVLFMNSVSLLPGSLAADSDGERLTLHVLDTGDDIAAELDRLERAIAGIYPHEAINEKTSK